MRRKQRGFWNFALPALASVAGSLINAEGQESANESNQGINSAQMANNAAEAAKAREFNATQAGINRTYNTDEMNAARGFNQYEAATTRYANHVEAETARNFNAQEAQLNRDFQERMRATQYQTAVGDMNAAGINPMLAIRQGGAGTPSGSAASGPAASSTNASSGAASSGAASGPAGQSGGMLRMENVAGAGIQGALAAAQVAQINSTTKVNEAQEAKIKSEIPKIEQETNNLKETIGKIQAEIEEISTRSTLNISNTTLNGYKYDLVKIQTQQAKGQISLQEAQTRVQNIQEKLMKYEEPEARNKANYQNKSAPSVISPALKDLGTLINGAGTLRGMAR